MQSNMKSDFRDTEIKMPLVVRSFCYTRLDMYVHTYRQCLEHFVFFFIQLKCIHTCGERAKETKIGLHSFFFLLSIREISVTFAHLFSRKSPRSEAT